MRRALGSPLWNAKPRSCFLGATEDTLRRGDQDATWRRLGGCAPDHKVILDAFQHPYNHHRPHGALNPLQYLSSFSAGAPPSHMS
jgi:hypothetical protein